MAEPAPERPLPAWSLPAGSAESLALPTQWPGRVTRQWAWGGSTGKGVRVCILDSGIEADHHEVADLAYFRRTVLVASAHNMPVESYPWRFSSVISVGSHEEPDAETFYYNPSPPVEFFARGVDVEIAWLGKARARSTGNSFATPHMSGICALILGKHPELTPFQLKSALYLTANNVEGRDD